MAFDRFGGVDAAFYATQARLTAEDLSMLIKAVALRAVRVNPREAIRILEQCRDALSAVKPPEEQKP